SPPFVSTYEHSFLPLTFSSSRLLLHFANVWPGSNKAGCKIPTHWGRGQRPKLFSHWYFGPHSRGPSWARPTACFFAPSAQLSLAAQVQYGGPKSCCFCRTFDFFGSSDARGAGCGRRTHRPTGKRTAIQGRY